MTTERTAAAASQGARVEWVDAMRGLAALAVVLFHVRVVLWAGWHEIVASDAYSAFDRAIAWLSLPLSFGGTTVMLFFILSGFAIHYPYAAPGRACALRPFAIRRWFRIYPPYAAAVLLTIAAEQAVARLGGAPTSPVARAAMSLAMVQTYAPPGAQLAGNPSLWSLPVEMELYLVYPVVLWARRAFGLRNVLVATGLVSGCAAAWLLTGATWPMGNFAKYWILWVSGAALAERYREGRLPPWRRSHAAALAAALALAIGARAVALPFGFEHFLWGGVYWLVVLWGLTRPSPLARLAAPVRWAVLFLGDISYSLYLVHFPVLLVLGAAWVAAFDHKPSNLFVALAATAAPIVVAAVWRRAFEVPSQTLGRALSAPHPAPVAESQVAVG